MDKTVVITGGSGFVAGSMIRQVPAGYTAHVLSRGKALVKVPNVVWHKLDPTDNDALVKCLEEVRPHAIVHTAAYAGIDFCQKEQAEAHRVNSTLTARVGKAAEELGCRFVYCSTDTVFDGVEGKYTEDSPTGPVNYYGETKVAGEVLTRFLSTPWVIARVAIVMGLPMVGSGNSFLSLMIPKFEAGEKVGVPIEEIRTPVDVVTLGRQLWELAGNDFTGVIHLSGDDLVNRTEMVMRIADALGYSRDLVYANDPADIPGRAARPVDVSLLNDKAHAVLENKPCSIAEGVRRIMAADKAIKEQSV